MSFAIIKKQISNMSKTTILNTLVMRIMTTDAEKQQKVAYHMFTCKFPISSLQCHVLLTL